MRKKRGLLSLELSLLTSLILTLMLFFTSLIYLIHIKESVRNAISEAAKSFSTEIYVYTKLSQDVELGTLSSAINDKASKEIGININLTELASEAGFSYLLERETYKRLGFQRDEPPFWLDGRIDVETKARSNNIYITTRVPVKLPVLSLFLKDMELEIRNVEAARGAEIALTGISEAGSKEKKENRSLVICANSLDHKNDKPVYHDKKCFGRLWEKEENSLQLYADEVSIDRKGDLNYKGRIYHYCKLCQSMKNKEGNKDE